MADASASTPYGGGALRYKRPVKETHIDIEIVIFDVLRSWWIVLIGCLITAMVSYMIVTERYTPTYCASATLVVTSKDSTSSAVYSNLAAANSLADTFAYVLESSVLRVKVAELLELEHFDGAVEARIIKNTNLVEMLVVASAPQLAFDEINAIINNHQIVSSSILGDAVLDVLKAPTVPTQPLTGMNRSSTVIRNSLIGALAIIAALVIASVARDNIMTENDLLEKVDCEPLTTIYHEKKNLSFRAKLRGVKTSMLITNPTTSFRFAETFRLFRTRIEYIMKRRGYKTLLITSVLENEGKTTMAANTAITLALNGKKVLLIDGDMLKPAQYKLLETRVRRGTAVNEIIMNPIAMENIPKMEGVPSLSLALGKAAISDSTEIISSKQMRAFLHMAREYFDYIIIDTPPIAYAADAENWAELAEASLLVIQQGAARAKRINDCIDAVKQSGTDILGCIFNNVRVFELFGAFAFGAKSYGGFRGSGYGKTGNESNGYGYGYARSQSGGSVSPVAPIQEMENDEDE